MLCWVPASRLSNVIVVATAGGSSIVSVSNSVSCATTVTPPPGAAGTPLAALALDRLQLSRHGRVDHATEGVRTGLERGDRVIDLGHAGHDLAREHGLARERVVVEDVDVVLDLRVLVVEPQRERLAGRGGERCRVELDVGGRKDDDRSLLPAFALLLAGGHRERDAAGEHREARDGTQHRRDRRAVGPARGRRRRMPRPAHHSRRGWPSTVAASGVTASRILENPNSTSARSTMMAIGSTIGMTKRSRRTGFIWRSSSADPALPVGARGHPIRRATHARTSGRRSSR